MPKPAQSGGEDEDGCWHCKGHLLTKRQKDTKTKKLKDKKTKRQKDKKTKTKKRQKGKKTKKNGQKRQKYKETKRYSNIVMSGEFRTICICNIFPS